jgi:hypothetical protein
MTWMMSAARPNDKPTSEVSNPGRQACSVILCHNRVDKPLVKDLADRIDLDFGVPHFLGSQDSR